MFVETRPTACQSWLVFLDTLYSAEAGKAAWSPDDRAHLNAAAETEY